MKTSKILFSPKEQEEIFALVEKIAGTAKVAREAPHIFLNNLQRRMYNTGCQKLKEYIDYTKKNIKEHNHLISALTIHTTYWFREARHLEFLAKELDAGRFQGTIKIMSLGCSTGEEVYSIALVLESYRQKTPGFDYSIEGFDIDPISIKKAEKAIYRKDVLSKIPSQYHNNILLGSGKTDGLLTLTEDIRKRCHFAVANALQINKSSDSYDIVFCRNMLIYFNLTQVGSIVRKMVGFAKTNGLIIVGHSEDIQQHTQELKRFSGSTYSKEKRYTPVTPSRREKTQGSSTAALADKPASQGINCSADILIVDDSKTIRLQLQSLVEKAGFTYVSAESADKADEILSEYNVELILLDLNMPGKSGDQWLQETRSQGMRIPCIIVTSASEQERKRVLDSLGKSAQDIFVKDQLDTEKDRFQERISSLIRSKQVFRFKPKSPVLVVDDDPDIAEMLKELIEEQGYQVKTFKDGLNAYNFLKANEAHCVLLDHKMPGMNGAELARKIYDMQKSLPVVIITGFMGDIVELERKGIIFRAIEKPADEHALMSVLTDAIHAKYSGELAPIQEQNLSNMHYILIGASTGGPQVLQTILADLRKPCPPIIVVQHIQQDFQLAFAESLKKTSGFETVVVKTEVVAQDNTIYVASPDKHVILKEQRGQVVLLPSAAEKYKGHHRPSVDQLFHSAAEVLEERSIAFLLTGMGDDGAQGMKKLKENGSVYTIAQNLESSTVFGMPKVAIDLGGACAVGDVRQIREAIRKITAKRQKVA